MNRKTILRVFVTLVVAAIGYWQVQTSRTAPENAQRQSGNKHPGGSGPNQSNKVGDFDYYLVSYSWSPTYCLSHPNDERQCGGRGFGFVLHGLWPQKSTGGWPEDCPGRGHLSQSVIDKALAFMPSEKLIAHEWAKHGTCSGLDAQGYFALADRAFAALKIPPGFQSPSRSRELSPDQILAEFTSANLALPADSLTLRCSGSELQEIRLCVSPQLQAVSCGKGVRTQCNRDKVGVRAVR